MSHRISLDRIAAAADVIDPVFLRSPQFVSEPLSDALGVRTVVKVETVNPIRCFKGRGADFYLSTLEDAQHPIEVALKNLGDVTLDFQLVVWVRNDTLMEPYRIRSLYLSAIDDAITRCGFPQPNPAYDVNVKGAPDPAAAASKAACWSARLQPGQ